MKIICVVCRSLLGESAPFDQDGESQVNICLSCKDKILTKTVQDEAEKTQKMKKSDAEQKVVLEGSEKKIGHGSRTEKPTTVGR